MTTVIRNLADTYVSQAVPTTRYGDAATLAVREGGPGRAAAYIKTASTVGRPPGGELVSAKLQLFLTSGFSGSRTFMARRVTEKFSSLTMNWNNRRPHTTVNQATVTTSNRGTGGMVEFDVTPLVLDALASLGGYVAFRVDTTGPLTRFHSVESKTAAYKPVLVLEWVTAPAAPRELVPSGGRAVSLARPTFLFDYASATRQMSGYQIQLEYGSDSFASPDLDTGAVDSATPAHVWGSDLTADTPFAWRVRVRDSGDEWSEWSAPVWAARVAKSSLSITSPSTVLELVPPVEWSFSGTQTRFQVLETHPQDHSLIRDDSRIIPGVDAAFTSSGPLNFFDGGTTRRVVRVWDDVDRASTPGDPAYVEAAQVVDLDSSINVETVENLTATVLRPMPLVRLEWTFPLVPDAFSILRDGVPVAARVDGDELHDGGNDFSWIDYTAGAGEHEWRVDVVMDHETSADSPTVTTVVPSTLAWILDPGDEKWGIPLAGPFEPLDEMGEESEVYAPAAAGSMILVSQALRGWEGEFTGTLAAEMAGVSESVDELKARLWRLKAEPVKVWRLMAGSHSIPVVIRNVRVSPQPGATEAVQVGFEYFQYGELPWAG